MLGTETNRATDGGATGAVITDWSAVSPFGVGREAFEQGLSAGHETARTPETAEWGVVADAGARLVPDFQVREVLGKAGTRGLDRATGLAITAVRELLRDVPDIVADGGLDTAVVLGTTTGSAQGYADLTRASFEGRRPQDVPPVAIPNMAMNRAASASAIFHGVRGPNSTIAAGRVAGLMALEYGRRLLAQHRADSVLVGATEEYSQARSWIEHHRRAGSEDRVELGEGSAVLLLERSEAEAAAAGRTVLAEVLSVTSRVDVDGDPAEALRACVAAALEAAEVTAQDVRDAVPSSCGGTPESAEIRVLTRMFGAEAVARPEIGSLIGDTSAAASLFQIVALLSTAQRRSGGGDRLAVVTATDPDGAVAGAVLRLLPVGR
ncbi:beta-ketoacyl synthase N-terminal-like domain-containing protein [Streptomyces sp. NPDC058239]|uniref:beta-ketoacyl synthase N-terminal-like domain-containing protein n=1 Tax=unclassified Streptomyces TaxID=2593676 RepID=UPI00364DFFE3